MRLVHLQGKWSILTLYTSLWSIQGHEEHIFDRRPRGVELAGKLDGMNWSEKRQQEAGLDDNHTLAVLVLGEYHDPWHEEMCRVMIYDGVS